MGIPYCSAEAMTKGPFLQYYLQHSERMKFGKDYCVHQDSASESLLYISLKQKIWYYTDQICYYTYQNCTDQW
jgi:hypothetical protein